MQWITRARPKIDRIACPWLITRFIDPRAEFLYVAAADVLRIAAETGATPYDIPGVEMGHNGELCSFDAFLKKYQLTDPALQRLVYCFTLNGTYSVPLLGQLQGAFAQP